MIFIKYLKSLKGGCPLKEIQEKKPAAERIFLHRDDELVTFASLTEEEKQEVREEVTVRLIESVMEGQGYKRVGEIHRKREYI